MGYVNFTVGIGWSIGSVLAGELYQEGGDKTVLARRYLVEKLGQASESIAELSKDQVLPRLYELAGVDAFEARALLWETYAPYQMWWIFAAIGIGSMISIIIYDYVVRKADQQVQHPFNKSDGTLVLGFLTPITGILIYLSARDGSPGLIANALFFYSMLVIALIERQSRTQHRLG